MSVASVTNKTLQLAELVISNEKFTGATGYVASSSSFSSSVAGSNLSTPQIVLTNDTSETTLSCLGVDTLSTPNVSTGNVSVNTALTLYGTPSTNNVSMACITDNQISLFQSGQSGANVSFGCSASGILNVVGGVTTAINGIVTTSAIQFLANGSSGILSVNSGGQLTYNGVAINVP